MSVSILFLMPTINFNDIISNNDDTHMSAQRVPVYVRDCILNNDNNNKTQRTKKSDYTMFH